MVHISDGSNCGLTILEIVRDGKLNPGQGRVIHGQKSSNSQQTLKTAVLDCVGTLGKAENNLGICQPKGRKLGDLLTG